MNAFLRSTLLAMAVGVAFAASSAHAQQPAVTKAADPTRPATATANRPSETGAQSSMPKGAVSGAGHPQVPGAQGPSADAPKKVKGKRTQAKTAKKRADATREQRDTTGTK